ncbi:hypothetical protein QJS04_geneDACA008953 [Acorus gramineus]|uniref:Methyltransferase domain-containing protein n=1 Tax=Acorus gramineus TaxID=55184 RepID=A0AAV9ABR5_ACOGR|nr:hypothetical protein QJS04_geneDACA008953 [Acorus gramineus]
MGSLVRTCPTPFNLRPSLSPPPRRTTLARAGKPRTLAMAAASSVGGADDLRKGIAELYDESSGLWENIWGDHMHHGFYDESVPASISDHRSAQIRMIENALDFAGVQGPPLLSFVFLFSSSMVQDLFKTNSKGHRIVLFVSNQSRVVADDDEKKPKRIVDVGCGIGGSSRYLAKKYGADCNGITLSPVQAQRAQALATSEGLADKVSFQVADALDQPFPDGHFDLFVGELVRVAAPGATIIIVTWCHRNLSPSEDSLRPEEANLLKKICDAYYLPAWCSPNDYVKLAQSLSLEDIKCADWSDNVAPFWPAVIQSALTWKGFTSLLRSGWKTIRGALVMPLMIEGYKKGLIKFTIITCRKPR